LEEEVSLEQLNDLFGESQWLLTKSMIETEAIEAYMEQVEEAPIEQVMIEATSTEWADAINALTAIAALVGNKKIVIEEATKDQAVDQNVYDKEWEWMHLNERDVMIRKRRRSSHPMEPTDV